MKKTAVPSVDINQIIDAFEMDGDFSRSFVNTKTGEVVSLMEGDHFALNLKRSERSSNVSIFSEFNFEFREIRPAESASPIIR